MKAFRPWYEEHPISVKKQNYEVSLMYSPNSGMFIVTRKSLKTILQEGYFDIDKALETYRNFQHSKKEAERLVYGGKANG